MRRALPFMPRVVFVFWALLLTSVGAGRLLWHQNHVTLDVRQGPQAHNQWKSSLLGCHERLTVHQMPDAVAASWNVRRVSARSKGGRFLTCNHKTGTFLASCIQKVTRKHGVSVHVSQDSANGGLENLFITDEHARVVNFIRDPFVLVDSGYAFHLKTNEPWTQSAVGKWGSRGEPMAAYPAIEEWRRWCAHHPAKVRLSNSSTYQGALLQLTQSSPAGMLLEALRALWATVPFMINSARSCAALNGSCTNVDLDQLMANYSAAWDHMLAPALRLGSEAVGEDAAREMRRDFISTCDLAAVVPKASGPQRARESGHATGHTGREERLTQIQQLDRKYLSGTLAGAREDLRRAARLD